MIPCRSWEHAGAPVPARDGHSTCALHAHEEDTIARIDRELAELGSHFQDFAAKRDRHPDEAKEFIERPLQAFLNAELNTIGLNCGRGFRGKRDFDIVVDLNKPLATANQWNATVTATQLVPTSRLGLHLEVAFRNSGTDLAAKMKSDISRLDDSIRAATALGQGLPWTGLVLVGPAWARNSGKVLEFVHKRYHAQELQRVTLEGQEWWPFPDAAILPGSILKKHDLFSVQDLTGTRLPCFLVEPCAPGDELRSLAIARGFLLHRIQVLRGQVPAEGPAWSLEQSGAICGELPPNLDQLKGVLLRHLPADVERLWHQGFDRDRRCPVPLPYDVLVNPTCNNGSKYLIQAPQATGLVA